MITLHHEKETDFKRNGYGFLDDYIFNEGGNWELNGEFKVEFEMPVVTEFTDYIKPRNIVQAPVPFMDRQLFRIYRTQKTLETIYVEARHIFYDLLDNWIEDTNIVGQLGNNAIQQILSNTQYAHRFTGSSNIESTANARMVRMNPVEALLDDGKDNTFINRWGGELLRDNFRIQMFNRRGMDRGVEIEHRKNLLGYEASIDVSTIVTRIQPVGFDGLMLPERYVDSEFVDEDHPVIAEVEFRDIKAAVGENEDDDDAVPLEEAYNLLREAAEKEFTVNNVDEPETVIDVDFVALHNTEQYKDLAQLQEIHGGDTVHVNVPDHGFNITSRLVAFEFSLLKENHYTSTTLGNHVFEFTSGSTEISNLKRDIEQVREESAVAVQSANSQNTNFYSEVEPKEDMKANDLWYKPVGEGEVELYRYTGSYWKLEKVSAGLLQGTLDADVENGDVDLINVNVNRLVGRYGEFVNLLLQSESSFTSINGDGLKITHDDGTYSQFTIDGLKRFTPSDERNYHYLMAVRTFVFGEANPNAVRWVQLPDDFKGKQFSVYLAISDSLNAIDYTRSIQRFVCTVHPNYSIDYANARVPVIAYKSETLGDGHEPEITNVQGILIAMY